MLSKAKQIHKRDLERLKSLRYMDDEFMTACLEDNLDPTFRLGSRHKESKI